MHYGKASGLRAKAFWPSCPKLHIIFQPGRWVQCFKESVSQGPSPTLPLSCSVQPSTEESFWGNNQNWSGASEATKALVSFVHQTLMERVNFLEDSMTQPLCPSC